MDGASGSHSVLGNALRDLLAGLARFRSPEFEALLTGFIGIATRLCNEFERILDEARRSRFFQDLERIRSGPPVPGYEAFLIDEGYEPFEAHLIGHAMNNLGMRLARLNWFDFKDYGCPIGSGVVGSLRGGQPSLRGPLGKPTWRHITPPAPRQTPAC